VDAAFYTLRVGRRRDAQRASDIPGVRLVNVAIFTRGIRRALRVPTVLSGYNARACRRPATVTLSPQAFSDGSSTHSILFGHFSERLGRQHSMVAALGLSLLVIPVWSFGTGVAMLAIGAFLMQAGVQGAWGIIPVHLSELAPDSVRGLVPGLALPARNSGSGAGEHDSARPLHTLRLLLGPRRIRGRYDSRPIGRSGAWSRTEGQGPSTPATCSWKASKASMLNVQC
jgi:hypothetical protein